MEQGFVTIMFTDLVGSTASCSHGDEAAERLRREHLAALRAAIANHGGREITSAGDGLMAAFTSAVAAVRCAVDMQRATTGAERGAGLRVGLDAGEPLAEAGNLHGAPLIVARRLCDAAGPGEILASEVVRRIAGPRIAETMGPPGAMRLEGISEPVAAGPIHWRDAAPEIPPGATPSPIGAAGDRPLLERDRELGALDSLLDSVVAGDGRVLLIEGPAGIGKTELMRVLRRRATGRGLRFLAARGGELERDFGFGITRQLLEPALATAQEASLFEGAAALAAPVFAARPDAGAQESGHAALHGLYWLVANLAERSPLVLAVDDVQWADAPSLRFLIHLARHLDGLSVALAIATRTGEPEDDLQRALRSEARPPMLRPKALSEGASGRIVLDALGADASTELRAACHEVSGGNPFLLSELLEELRSSGRDARDLSPAAVASLGPERIASALLLRLGRVDRDAPALARAIATLGTDATVDDAAELAGLAPSVTRSLAWRLAEAAILDRGEPLRFIHPIVRTAIYQDIPVSERERLHARAAELLRSDPEAAALHLLSSAPSGDAEVVATLTSVAADAVARGAPETAVRYLRRALAEPPQPELRPQLLYELGMATDTAGDTRQAIRSLREALDASPSPEQRARAALQLGRVLAWSAATRADAAPVLARGIEALGHDGGPLRWELEAQLLATELMVGEDADESRPGLVAELLTRAADGFDRLPAEAQQLLGGALSVERAVAGDSAARSIALANAALRQGELLATFGDHWPFAVACLGLLFAGRPDQAERESNEGMAYARRRGSPLAVAGAASLRAFARSRQGRLAGAEADARLALETMGDERWQAPHHVALPALVSVLVARGRVDEAGGLLEAFAAVIPGESCLRQLVREAHVALLLTRGDLRGALDELRRYEKWTKTRTPPGNGLAPFSWRPLAAIAWARLSDHARALDLATEELELARRYGDPVKLGVALRTAGQVATGESGIDLLTESVDVLAASPARLEHAAALIELGSAQRRAGRRTQGRERLGEGMDVAHRCGADALVERAHDELIRSGARPRRRAVTGTDALTPSERRVCELATEGMTNKEIAQALFVTLRTVEMHLSSAYRKLGIDSRSKLAAELAPSR
ncbi:MAG TPA: AAA family ATPase [Solirubrobacteraceae bacterium]|nr:AAA family ATPase [Solirubrobacteraceae bacterium]